MIQAVIHSPVHLWPFYVWHKYWLHKRLCLTCRWLETLWALYLHLLIWTWRILWQNGIFLKIIGMYLRSTYVGHMGRILCCSRHLGIGNLLTGHFQVDITGWTLKIIFLVKYQTNRVNGCSTSPGTLETWFTGHIQVEKNTVSFSRIVLKKQAVKCLKN